MLKKTLGSAFALSLLLGSQTTSADSKITDDIFIKGADLNSNELEQTKKELHVTDGYKEYSITTQDVAKYTGNSSLSYIHSSATIEPKKFSKGVSVEIVTPNNITRITKEQYTNAAISAGVQNANIKIASIDQVTGEGALSGIFKSYEKNGNALNQNDINNAQEEMNQLATISEENKNQKGYSDEVLNHAVAKMKEEIASQKQDNKNLDNQQINNIVDKELKDSGLIKVLSDKQITVINNIMINVSNSEIMNQDPKSFEKQADSLKSSIKDKAGGLVDKAKSLDTQENRNFLQKIWDFIVNFFQWIYNSVMRLINF
ncbi:DUF1002 domain-containing protein [Staphylococcus pseudintermedius]|uniref:DUF1002 domain-containing protein n=1 Tax=Staphylococcus pseudintermedius TaxID=283734 RepID=UPI00112144D7|nr:DUF1002 domain-containing protein [Staphylococcus pseudintermedius]EGQ2703031.1 DUF1002 domain-containing protein [Staphylococcus pseudintermedius]EGQ3154369.1 DUF1002 domain-containing protein [Staphylococcus pseudintermedius]EGQ3173023.1 DUF1002 domain-containing protein [Staphylococcus pseudintermedius]EGQ3229918.1 DUF1002 domain-containing protein [Staphylococcus pseudintermedius]EGQ4153752.1 DUF1002 domain-containing protein [Staphylococcus pseudintermedius]